ncbi:MAG: TonB-dependent receptor, partial [Pyrinomonadaceae bacterium]|nr:TonB-dependent receptor [Sphingobacteriaceae bacterium]
LGYKTGKFSQVSMAYGKFYQNPEDDYLVQTNKLDFEQADHYILNYQRINAGPVFRIESYYKDYKNLVKQSNSVFNNAGDGYARGVDVFWRDKKTFKGIDYWLSYSFLDTKRDFRNYPVSSVPPFAARHTLNAVYKQYIKQINSQIGATYTYASGRTFFNPNNPVYLGDKTKDFQNLSINVSYLTHIFKQFTVVYFSVNNLPGFKNVYGYHFSDDGQVKQSIEPPARRSVFLGIFLTIGDNTFVR